MKRQIDEAPTNEKERCDALRRALQRVIAAVWVDANTVHNAVDVRVDAESRINKMGVSEC